MSGNPVGALRGTMQDPRFAKYLRDNFYDADRYGAANSNWFCWGITRETFAHAVNEFNQKYGHRQDADGVTRSIGLGAIDLNHNQEIDPEEITAPEFEAAYVHYRDSYNDDWQVDCQIGQYDLDEKLKHFTDEQKEYKKDYNEESAGH